MLKIIRSGNICGKTTFEVTFLIEELSAELGKRENQFVLTLV